MTAVAEDYHALLDGRLPRGNGWDGYGLTVDAAKDVVVVKRKDMSLHETPTLLFPSKDSATAVIVDIAGVGRKGLRYGSIKWREHLCASAWLGALTYFVIT